MNFYPRISSLTGPDKRFILSLLSAWICLWNHASVIAADSPAKTKQLPEAVSTKNQPVPIKKAPTKPEDPYPELERLTTAMHEIRKSFVDKDKVSYKQLVDGALRGMLSGLDPHCEYMARDLYEDIQREQADSSEGVGITVALRQGQLIIVTVREDGPAAKAGILGGDQLMRINEVLTDNVGVVEAIKLLKGKAGESIRLTVRRPGTKQFLEFNVMRALLHDSSVVDAMILHSKLAAQHKIGYVRLSEFTQATAKDLSTQLDKLEAEGMEALVLDVRNNPGGLLDTAIAVCGEFLPENTVVISTEGRDRAEDPPPYRTPKREGKAPRKYPVAVMVNHGSASAAEILAAVLQDLSRAIIVGTQSFGKGSVQTLLPMKDGSALRLTTARYFSPSHRTIHEQGVTPNIVSALTTEEELAVARWRNNHTEGETAAWDLTSLGDKQLERAVDTLKGVLVYQSFRTPAPVAEKNKPQGVKEEAKLDALLAPTNTKIDD